MKYLHILLVLFILTACETYTFTPETIEGQCYIFEPPYGYEYSELDTLEIVEINEHYIKTVFNTGAKVKFKKGSFEMYLRPTPKYNCTCYGYN